MANDDVDFVVRIVKVNDPGGGVKPTVDTKPAVDQSGNMAIGGTLSSPDGTDVKIVLNKYLVTKGYTFYKDASICVVPLTTPESTCTPNMFPPGWYIQCKDPTEPQPCTISKPDSTLKHVVIHIPNIPSVSDYKYWLFLNHNGTAVTIDPKINCCIYIQDKISAYFDGNINHAATTILASGLVGGVLLTAGLQKLLAKKWFATRRS